VTSGEMPTIVMVDNRLAWIQVRRAVMKEVIEKGDEISNRATGAVGDEDVSKLLHDNKPTL
jgi:hypothetical protein